MPVPVRATLLAVAALAALALAAVRITSAAEHQTTAEPATRKVTRAQAAATLEKLRAPPGFRQVTPCRFPEENQKCFWTPRALVTDVPEAERIAASEGTRAVGLPLASGCFGANHLKGGLVYRHCAWNLEIGRELVVVFSDSLRAPPGPPRTRFARKAFHIWRRGTEIRMSVVGH